ncbi:substrate-binding domain-containing protein [Nonomuraea jiangxiensis]|uniref:Ca-activated chloride channel family protein n=1 Tax=Nonomuraea jiangxiensis TaxID=633440 RepID=A0A1G9DLL7_9ACTN|nr:substrate-binding domain-containing protein [Nonomuraea jiangxiensis]SDK64787.1 Ca-activated chloride channel family protein [Nonomuraea jiangxiensis]
MRRSLAAALLVPVLLLAGCGSGGDPGGQPADGPDVLRVLAGSEIKDLEPLLRRAEAEAGVKVRLTYTGTLDGAEQVAGGRADGNVDATWFSSNRYLSLIDGAASRLATQTKIMVSPVVLGLKPAKASELGWDGKQVTWADIAQAAKDGRFSFGMTNPASSNSGFSALVGVAAALADAAGALTAEQVESVTPRLKDFFSAQRLTAGSSGWLADAYARDQRVDGMVNYESVLLGMRDPLTLVYPGDGVVSADYPLTLLASAPDAKKSLYDKLAAWLRTPAVQKDIMTGTHRRPIVPGITPDSRFGDHQLIELPFPNRRSTADELISTYLNRVRVPAEARFVLDTSGSMTGDRIAGLRQALTALTGADTSASGAFTRFSNRETVTMFPFNDTPGRPIPFTVPERDPASVLADIKRFAQGLDAAGGTAIYDSLRAAYDLPPTPGHYTSVVLMTDGENTDGSDYAAFESYYRALPQDRRAPAFVVLFGESDVEEMRQVAELTGGALFDARSTSLSSAFKEIRGYQ